MGVLVLIWVPTKTPTRSTLVEDVDICIRVTRLEVSPGVCGALHKSATQQSRRYNMEKNYPLPVCYCFNQLVYSSMLTFQPAFESCSSEQGSFLVRTLTC